MAHFMEADSTFSSSSSGDGEDKDDDKDESQRKGGEDSMMKQDARAAKAKLQDVGYREGKTELVDANINAQASFEKGVLSGFDLSERAGRIRGMLVTLVAIHDKDTKDGKVPSIQSDKTVQSNNTNNNKSDDQTEQGSIQKMRQLIEQLQSLSNPTLLSDELIGQCESVLAEHGLTP